VGKSDPKIEKAFKDMKADLADFLRDANAKIAGKRKEVEAFAKAAEAADKQHLAAHQKVVSELNRTYDSMKGEIASLVKTYMAVVRDTDGLTSVRPGVAKALDRYSVTLDEKHLEEATAVLEKHKSEVLKQADKKDKAAIAFGKAIDDLIAELG
jgi:hypothetical protein